MSRVPLLVVMDLALLGVLAISASLATGDATICLGDIVITPINEFANIRKSPAVAPDNLLGQLKKGEIVKTDDLKDGWYHLASGGYVSASVVTASCITGSPVPSPNATATQTIVIVTQMPRATPTRIETNTLIPAAERTHAAMQYGEQLCIFEPGGGRICHLFAFGTRFEWQTVQVQP